MIREQQEIVQVAIGDLVGEAGKLRGDGYRLVQIGCTKTGDQFEINYSFDKDYSFKNLRLTIASGTEVPSISGVYFGAFVYENEIHDLFGVKVTGINVDYQGNLYKTTVKYPFSVTTGKEEGPCERL